MRIQIFVSILCLLGSALAQNKDVACSTYLNGDTTRACSTIEPNFYINLNCLSFSKIAHNDIVHFCIYFQYIASETQMFETNGILFTYIYVFRYR